MDNITIWLDKVQQICRQTEQPYIDIIIDQCGMDFSVIPALSGFSPEIKWHSLYEGLPEDIHREDAPLLVRIELDDEQQVRWLYDLAREVSATAPLLIVSSRWPFSLLANWLGQCTDARHEGRAGIFRFWDTRIFPYLFTDVLDDDQKHILSRPALFWSWLDRDGKPALLNGDGARPEDGVASSPISFNDSQFESQMCLCDTTQLLSYRFLPENLFLSKEAEFAACFAAMQAATQNGLIFDDERDAWVVSQLIN